MSGPAINELVRDYGDAQAEATACRRNCALFDFSFVARASVRGPGARALLEQFQPRRLDTLRAGRIVYALRNREDGSVLSDLTIWRLGEDSYELMSGRHLDIVDLVQCGDASVRCEDATENTAIFALQGPRSLEALTGLTDVVRLEALPYFAFTELELCGVTCCIGRLGYTGERGFEFIVARDHAMRLWEALSERARPAGFAAADRLRIEAGYILFANEGCLGATPAELGLERFASGASQTPAAIRMVHFTADCDEPPVLMGPDQCLSRPERSGEIAVTSACYSPLAGGVAGLGFVLPDDARDGAALRDNKGSLREIRCLAGPLHDPGRRRPRAPW